MSRVALVLVLLGALVPARVLRGADPTSASPGNVRFAKTADSAFDVYSQSPTQSQKDWMTAHYWRMLTYTPYFDARLTWFPNAWVYKDLYSIPTGSALVSSHPDWILHDASGNRLSIPWGCSGGTCPQYAADIGNPAFRANWIQEATATLAKGYRGLFVDDVNLLISRVSNGSGQPVVPIDPRTGKPMPESDWRRYMAEFTELIRTTFPQKEIVHNLLWFVGTSDPYAQREMLAADVICLERGVNDSGIVGGSGTFGFDTFLGLIDWLHQRGRSVFFLSTTPTDQGREYGLAAYFLVNSGTDAIGNDPGGTPADWWPGYDISLGAAAGPRYAANGVLRRDFDGGTVVVNPPGAASVTVQLGGTYLDVAGKQQTAVTLGSAQGAVLRRTGGTPTVSPPHLLDVVPAGR